MIPVAYCIFELMFYLIPVQQEYLFNQTGTCYSEFNLGKGCLGRVESMWASGQEIVAADCMESFNCTDTDVCWFILPSIHKVSSYVVLRKTKWLQFVAKITISGYIYCGVFIVESWTKFFQLFLSPAGQCFHLFRMIGI